MAILKTFKDFLNTGSAKDIQEKCQPFLKESGGLPLYRGYKMSAKGHFGIPTEITVRKDRRPRDSALMVHNAMDQYFLKKLGVKVRSEALFATGNANFTRQYGSAHYLFPVGDFKYVWAQLNGEPLKDSIVIARKINDVMHSRREADIESVTKEVLDQVTWRTDNLEEAIKHGVEIAILVNQAILVPVGRTPYEKIIGK